MSPPAGTSEPLRTGGDTGAGGGGPRRRALVTAAGVLIVLVATALAAGPPRPGEAFDPGNVGPHGLAALVDLLEASDVDVDTSMSRDSDLSTNLFIPRDRLSEAEREEVAGWVEAGGTAVVAGPSALHGPGVQVSDGAITDLFGATAREPACDLPGLTSVGRVEHAGWSGVEVTDGGPVIARCFDLGDEVAWMVVRSSGDGHVVSIGSALPFTNANLDRADNAVLAVALLGPSPGDRVAILPPAAVGSGDTPVAELVPTGFWRLLVLGAVAAVLAIVWRARRLGRPVPERLPPVLPGAELAHSVAALLQRSGDRVTAAARLRDDVRREASRVLGMPLSTEHEQLARSAAARSGVDLDTATRALVPSPVDDDAALRRIARATVELRAGLRLPGPTAGEPPGGEPRRGELGGTDDSSDRSIDEEMNR